MPAKKSPAKKSPAKKSKKDTKKKAKGSAKAAKVTEYKCPVCGEGPMIERTRKRDGNPFFGCRNFPRCRGTRDGDGSANANANGNGNGNGRPKSNRYQRANGNENWRNRRQKDWSWYQKAVFKAVEEGRGNYVVEAVAGGAKTSTGEEAICRLLESGYDGKIGFFAFGKDIARELEERMPPSVDCSTTHSLGFKTCRFRLGGKIRVEKYKLEQAMRETVFPDPTWGAERGEDVEDPYIIERTMCRKLIPLLKNTLSDPTPQAIMAVMERYGLLTAFDWDGPEWDKVRPEVIAPACEKVLDWCKENTHIVDFDDMIWLPVVKELPPLYYSLIFVDETQDLNKCQIEFIKRCVGNRGRVIAVGDRHQSIYGFRGADTDAIPNVIEGFNAEVLPLSVTYRCDRAIVNNAKPLVPHLESRQDAGEGEVLNMAEDASYAMMQEGDMVLCRVNAPLLSGAFRLIKRGMKAIVRGRDIGEQLVVLIKKLTKGNANSVAFLQNNLDIYRQRESERLAKKESALQTVLDRCDCIEVLMEGAGSVNEVIAKVESIFSDERQGVVFSTVHKAKGLESDRVFILHPEKMPLPLKDAQDWELIQERNIKYVAITRARHTLVWVGASAPAPALADAFVPAPSVEPTPEPAKPKAKKAPAKAKKVAKKKVAAKKKATGSAKRVAAKKGKKK